MFLQIVLNSCAICCCKRCANNIFDKSSDKRWNNGAFWLMKQVRDGLTLFQERIRTTGWKDYNGLPFKEHYVGSVGRRGVILFSLMLLNHWFCEPCKAWIVSNQT